MNNFLPVSKELHIEATSIMDKTPEEKTLKKKQLANLKKYGAKDWYDWSIKNWGTKWDARSYCKPEKNGNEIIFHFDTAWGPPCEFIKNIAPKYPKLRFTLEYSEPGMCFSGIAEAYGDDYSEIHRDGEVWPEHQVDYEG